MSKVTLFFKGKALQIYSIIDNHTVNIGSDKENTIYIDSLAISPLHAHIISRNGIHILEDLGSESGTFINEQPVTRPYTLKDNDRIQIGKHELLYSFEDIDDTTPVLYGQHTTPKKSAWLQILNGSNVGKTFPLKNNITNIGKKGQQTAIISLRQDNKYYLSHLDGNKTPKVNNKDIGESSYLLHNNTTIEIGAIKMLFYYL